MAKHRVEIYLDDKEEKFLKWLTKYDNDNRTIDQDKMTVNKELTCLLSVQLMETMEHYESEYNNYDNL